MPKVANSRVIAAGWAVLPLPALIPRLEPINFPIPHWIPNPLKRLPICHEPNIIHLNEGIEKGFKSFLVMCLSKPGRVVVKTKWSSVCGVVTFKVFCEELVDAFGCGWVGTGVAHGTAAALQIRPHDHGHLPNARITFRRTRWNHAIMKNLIIQSIRPTWRPIFIDRHGAVISEINIMKHFEHVISTNCEEWGSHSANFG